MPSGNEGSHYLDGLTVRGGLAIEGPAGAKAFLNQANASPVARHGNSLQARGLIAESFPVWCAGNASIQGSGTQYYTPIGLSAGDVITNIIVGVGTAGSSFSGIGSKVGIYQATQTTTAPILVASSGDISATVSATGFKTLPLSAPYTVPVDGGYYLAWLSVATTPPTPIRATLGSANVLGVTGSGVVGIGGTQAGQTDLIATATVAFNSQSAYWMAVN